MASADAAHSFGRTSPEASNHTRNMSVYNKVLKELRAIEECALLYGKVSSKMARKAAALCIRPQWYHIPPAGNSSAELKEHQSMIDKARSAAANLMFDFGCCTPLKIDEEPVAALWESAHLSPKSLKIKAHKPPSHTTTPDAKTTVMSKAYHPKVADPQGSVEPATPEKRVAPTTSAKMSQAPVADLSKDYPTPTLVLPPATPTAQPTACKAAAEDQDVVTSQGHSKQAAAKTGSSEKKNASAAKPHKASNVGATVAKVAPSLTPQDPVPDPQPTSAQSLGPQVCLAPANGPPAAPSQTLSSADPAGGTTDASSSTAASSSPSSSQLQASPVPAIWKTVEGSRNKLVTSGPGRAFQDQQAKTAAHREERAELRTKVVEAHQSGDGQAVQRALQAQQAHQAPPRQPRTEQEAWIAFDAFKRSTIRRLTKILKDDGQEARRLFTQLQQETDDRVRGACQHSFGKKRVSTYLDSFVGQYTWGRAQNPQPAAATGAT